MTVEDCTTYIKAEDAGYRRYNDPADPAQKILRAFDIETGKVVWQIVLPGPVQSNYSGVLTTSGGLVFFGESSGGFAAVDARNGKYLWHFETNHAIRGLTYDLRNRWPAIHRHRFGVKHSLVRSAQVTPRRST